MATTARADDGVVIVPQPPTLGAGYDPVAEAVVGRCIDFSPAAMQQVGGVNDTASIEKFDSSQSVRKEFSLSGAATFGFGLFGGSAGVNLIQDESVSKYSLYMHVLVKSQQKAIVLDPGRVRLSKSAAALANKPATFLRRCGTEFFSSIRSGGTFEAVLRFDTQSDEAQSQLSTALSASGWGVSADLNQKLNQVVSSTSSNLTVLYPVRSGVSEPLPEGDVASLIAYALAFPAKVKADAADNAPVAVSQLSYSNIAGPSLPAVDSATAAMETLADAYETWSKLAGDAKYIQLHPEQFSPRAQFSASDLSVIQTTIEDIRQKARICESDYRQCDPRVAAPTMRGPERLVWRHVDVTNINFQPVGQVPPGEQRTLEAKGVWNCNGQNPVCWQNAEDTIQFRIVDASGAVVDSGTTSHGTAVLTHSGSVLVRVGDGPGVVQFQDNTEQSSNPVMVAVW